MMRTKGILVCGLLLLAALASGCARKAVGARPTVAPAIGPMDQGVPEASPAAAATAPQAPFVPALPPTRFVDRVPLAFSFDCEGAAPCAALDAELGRFLARAGFDVRKVEPLVGELEDGPLARGELTAPPPPTLPPLLASHWREGAAACRSGARVPAVPGVPPAQVCGGLLARELIATWVRALGVDWAMRVRVRDADAAGASRVKVTVMLHRADGDGTSTATETDPPSSTYYAGYLADSGVGTAEAYGLEVLRKPSSRAAAAAPALAPPTPNHTLQVPKAPDTPAARAAHAACLARLPRSLALEGGDEPLRKDFEQAWKETAPEAKGPAERCRLESGAPREVKLPSTTLLNLGATLSCASSTVKTSDPGMDRPGVQRAVAFQLAQKLRKQRCPAP